MERLGSTELEYHLLLACFCILTLVRSGIFRFR